MDQEIKDTIIRTLNETKIDLIEPDKTEIEIVLQLKSSHLASSSEEDLTRYIYTLSQYIVFLQVQSNARNIRFIEAKRSYELALSKECSKIPDKKTVKEREQTALLGNESLQELEKNLRVKEADYRIFEKVPDHISEIINALKKELQNRQPARAYK